MPGIISEIVELSVFYRKDKLTRYLLLRRSAEKQPYPGIWQFVTGHVEKGERSLDAVLRELKEETGLSPEAVWFVPYTLQFYDPKSDKIHLTPFFAAQVSAGSAVRLSKEHDMYAWLTYRRAISRLPWPAQREGLAVVHKYLSGREEVSRLTRLG